MGVDGRTRPAGKEGQAGSAARAAAGRLDKGIAAGGGRAGPGMAGWSMDAGREEGERRSQSTSQATEHAAALRARSSHPATSRLLQERQCSKTVSLERWPIAIRDMLTWLSSTDGHAERTRTDPAGVAHNDSDRTTSSSHAREPDRSKPRDRSLRRTGDSDGRGVEKACGRAQLKGGARRWVLEGTRRAERTPLPPSPHPPPRLASLAPMRKKKLLRWHTRLIAYTRSSCRKKLHRLAPEVTFLPVSSTSRHVSCVGPAIEMHRQTGWRQHRLRIIRSAGLPDERWARSTKRA